MLHLDLKSANILLDGHYRAKVADVGVAQVLQGSYVHAPSAVGTFAWMAPEVFLGGCGGAAGNAGAAALKMHAPSAVGTFAWMAPEAFLGEWWGAGVAALNMCMRPSRWAHLRGRRRRFCW